MRGSAFKHGAPISSHWRGQLTWLLFCSMLTACQARTPGELEKEASACPDEQPIAFASREYFVALNAYYLQEEGARAIRSGVTLSPSMEEVFNKAKALGVSVLRSWAFNDDPEKNGDSAMQTAPLEYDETALRGLDLVLARASAHAIQLVMPLGNYWNDYGGARQYVAWAGLPQPIEGDPRFFTERRVVDHYKEHLRRLLNRINSFDGLRYGDHPAILAWELLNEPRNRGLDDQGELLRAWVDEVGAHVKSLSMSKWVGTGEEGFESPTGHFKKNLESPYLDFGSIHFFPESWNIPPEHTATAGAQWLYEHAKEARQLGKPLFLGELGLRNDGAFTLEERRAMYWGWFTCARRTGLAGVAPWLFAYDARPDAWDMHTFYFRDGTQPQDTQNRYADLIVRAGQR